MGGLAYVSAAATTVVLLALTVLRRYKASPITAFRSLGFLGLTVIYLSVALGVCAALLNWQLFAFTVSVLGEPLIGVGSSLIGITIANAGVWIDTASVKKIVVGPASVTAIANNAMDYAVNAQVAELRAQRAQVAAEILQALTPAQAYEWVLNEIDANHSATEAEKADAREYLSSLAEGEKRSRFLPEHRNLMLGMALLSVGGEPALDRLITKGEATGRANPQTGR